MERNGHDVALPERGLGVAFDDGAIFLDLPGLDGDAFDDGGGVRGRHALRGEVIADDAVIESVSKLSASDEVAGRVGIVVGSGKRAWMRGDHERAANGLGSNEAIDCVHLAGHGGIDDVDAGPGFFLN